MENPTVGDRRDFTDKDELISPERQVMLAALNKSTETLTSQIDAFLSHQMPGTKFFIVMTNDQFGKLDCVSGTTMKLDDMHGMMIELVQRWSAAKQRERDAQLADTPVEIEGESTSKGNGVTIPSDGVKK